MEERRKNDTAIIEQLAIIGNDIVWLKSDAIKRNHKIEKHIIDSDKYRACITRNTVWRHAYKFGFLIVFGILSTLAYIVYAN